MKIFCSVEKKGRRIDFLTALAQVSSYERRKKVGTEGCMWDPELGKTFMLEGEWLQDGYARAGVSAVVIGKNAAGEMVAIMNRFDSGHPTRAGQLTPPAGLWDRNVSLKEMALSELGEEVIVMFNDKIGHWLYGSSALELGWVEQYADDKDIPMVNEHIEISDMDVLRGDVFDVFLDGDFQGQALLACEPDTGSVEIMFLFKTEIVLSSEMFADGEVFNNQYLDREVGVFSACTLDAEKQLTSKAEMVRDFLKSL